MTDAKQGPKNVTLITPDGREYTTSEKEARRLQRTAGYRPKPEPKPEPQKAAETKPKPDTK